MSLLTLRPWRPGKERERKARRRRKVRQVVAREGIVVDLAASPTAEHAATFLDGHATASGGVGAITANRASPGETGRREGENDMWGPHVRFDFHLISNLWIVTVRSFVHLLMMRHI